MPASPQRSLIVVDDELSYLNFLGMMLKEHLSCPVHTFHRPEQALDALVGLNAGFVVTDYYMPHLNGFDLVRASRQKVPGLPFVLITGHGSELQGYDFSNLPEIRSVLTKPFRCSLLADEILKHWQGEDCPSITSPL